ncbi:unnamed protein product [Ectocarpus fasciculatus]
MSGKAAVGDVNGGRGSDATSGEKKWASKKQSSSKAAAAGGGRRRGNKKGQAEAGAASLSEAHNQLLDLFTALDHAYCFLTKNSIPPRVTSLQVWC